MCIRDSFLGASIDALAGRGVRRIALNPNWLGRWTDDDCAASRDGYERAAEGYVGAYRAARPFALNVFDDKIALHLLGPAAGLHGCGFGEWDVAVAPSGRLYPCGRVVGEDHDGALAMGCLLYTSTSPRDS